MLAVVQSAAQGIQTGNNLKEGCQFASQGAKTNLEAGKALYCQGFVKGILFIGRRLNEPESFCPPTGVTVTQAINVFLKYLNENPDKSHQAAEDVTIQAFWKAWHCK